jgi:carbonic anhydrase
LVYEKNETELNSIVDENERERRLVELNVQQQVWNLCSTSFIQRAWHRNGGDISKPGFFA